MLVLCADILQNFLDSTVAIYFIMITKIKEVLRGKNPCRQFADNAVLR